MVVAEQYRSGYRAAARQTIAEGDNSILIEAWA
jgi:hypothetical protein